jgi:hypothetical protein
MNQDTMRDRCERIARTTKELWDASPYPVPPVVRPRLGLLVIKPKAYDSTPHKEQRHP